MKTIIKLMGCIIFAGSLLSCSDYTDHNESRMQFYKVQERDPDLIGWWTAPGLVNEPGENLEYIMELNSNGLVHYHHRPAGGSTVTINHAVSYYWYTENGIIHRLEVRSGTESGYYKWIELSNTYTLSADKNTLTLPDSTGEPTEHIRIEQP